MNRINTWLSHGRITQWSMYVILSVAEGNERNTTTFLDVPPNRFGCRGDDNERTNERERTSTPPPATLCATGKGGGRSGATHLDKKNVSGEQCYLQCERFRALYLFYESRGSF